jgi:hypothetical protein
MNTKEIAKQFFEFNDNEVARVDMIDLCRFADYVDAQAVAKEREGIAKMFEAKIWAYEKREIVAAIRARGNHEQD